MPRPSPPAVARIDSGIVGLTTLETRLIYKVLGRAEWYRALVTGSFPGSAADLRDGFIHLSRAEQLAGTLTRHFDAAPDLLLLGVDPTLLGATLRFEASRDGALFPHLYAPLPAQACRALAVRAEPRAPWAPVDA
jgi:uncharacterized protein (DUF952 family)